MGSFAGKCARILPGVTWKANHLRRRSTRSKYGTVLLKKAMLVVCVFAGM